MDKNVFLENEAAKRLYRTVKDLPIIDYHCHLSPAEIMDDTPFDNIGQMWLAGDHYKWRLMRACGIDEAYITGEASWKDKFLQYARAVSASPGNPLYHWTHMELQMYFQIDTPLSAKTAEDIWLRANRVIAEQKLSPRRLIAASRVRYIATTDGPTDDLAYHEKIAEDKGFKTIVSPCFRTDALLSIRQSGYPRYIERLSGVSDIQIGDMDTLESAVIKRLDFFCRHGCKFSDVGIPEFPGSFATRSKADAAFKKAVNGEPVTDAEYDGFLGYMFSFLAGAYKKRSIVMQLHLAPYRNANSTLLQTLGRDCGGDCVGDVIPAKHIAALLDRINTQSGLPDTILYTLNPNMYYTLYSIAGSFSNVRCGAAWWFCDHKTGIENMLNTLAEMSSISTFLGMLTDSRSFLSYARHDYFRRILCTVIGGWIEKGEYPEDESAYELVSGICHDNIANLINKSM